jgi:hypothetical protein
MPLQYRCDYRHRLSLQGRGAIRWRDRKPKMTATPKLVSDKSARDESASSRQQSFL